MDEERFVRVVCLSVLRRLKELELESTETIPPPQYQHLEFDSQKTHFEEQSESGLVLLETNLPIGYAAVAMRLLQAVYDDSYYLPEDDHDDNSLNEKDLSNLAVVDMWLKRFLVDVAGANNRLVLPHAFTIDEIITLSHYGVPIYRQRSRKEHIENYNSSERHRQIVKIVTDHQMT